MQSDMLGFPFQVDATIFRDKFNRKPFELSHSLTDSPLFQLAKLMQVAFDLRDKPGYHLYCDFGDVSPENKWAEVDRQKLPIEEAIRRINEEQAWVMLKHCDDLPEYRALLDRCMQNLSSLAGQDLKKVMDRDEVIIWATSPNRTTPYHVDSECNFLLQISGTKTLYVFDREDREVLPEEEIEQCWCVDHNSAIYRSQFQDRAQVFKLRPGSAVHIPVNCPHWLQNDDNISISVSINFIYKSEERRDVYRVNHFLRKLGLQPTPPFKSPWLDKLKVGVLRAGAAIKHVVART